MARVRWQRSLCFVMHKQRAFKESKVSTHIDLSALYPADPIRPLCRRRRKTQADHENSPRHQAEYRAVRQALAGWRWL